MGTDISATTVIGFHYSEIGEEKQVKKFITKYNENTGKPYQKKYYETELYFKGEKVSEKMLAEFDEWQHEQNDCVDEITYLIRDSGLRHEPLSYLDYQPGFIGVVFKSAHEDEPPVSLTLEEIQEGFEKAKAGAKILGLENVEIKLHKFFQYY